MATGERLWRVRRRHHHIDAVLREEDGAFELQYLMDDRAVVALPYPTRAAADEEALRRRRELERAGWTAHW